MRRSLSALALAIGLPIASAGAMEFAGSVPTGGYTSGDIGTSPCNDPLAALGKPDPLNGASLGYPTVLNPFSPPWEPSQIVAIGQGGSLTLHFASPHSIKAAPQIGVFTTAGLNDPAFNGSPGPVAQTFTGLEYGAERSALVEVADSSGVFHSVGRVKFASPTNYYNNTTGPYSFPAPSPASEADFAKPFTAPTSAFDGKTFSQVLDVFDGSAGGTWITIPADLGISEFEYIRFSQPLWILPDYSTAVARESLYSNAMKNADLFVDAVVAVPEPGIGLALLGVVLLGRRRR